MEKLNADDVDFSQLTLGHIYRVGYENIESSLKDVFAVIRGE